MSNPSINWNPDRKILAEFSEIWLFFLGMIAAPLSYFRGHERIAVAFWVLAVVGRLVGLVRPMLLKPVFVGMMAATWPIGWVVSKLSMGLLYFGVLTPIAFVFRLTGRDAMRLKLEPQAPTYWETYNPDRGADRYLRQF